MYISKILVQEILRQIGKKIKNDKDLIALLVERHAEIWEPHFVDASLDELGPLLKLEPFDSWWLGKFTTTAADCLMRIKEILAAKAGRGRPPVPRKISLLKQELREIAEILKIRIPKGANQWDVFGKIAAEVIKEQKRQMVALKIKKEPPFGSSSGEVIKEGPHPHNCRCDACSEKHRSMFPEI